MTTATKKVKKKSTQPAPKESVAIEVTTPRVGVRELRQSASQVLDLVKAGTTVEITEHGVPVARLVPITRSLYQDYIDAGFIISAVNPDWRPTDAPGKVIGKKTSTQVLTELRAEERS